MGERAIPFVWALCLACVSGACDVAIFGRIEPEGEPVRSVADEGWVGSVSVGLLGERTLVEWMRSDADGDTPSVRWLDRDLRPVGEPIRLGLGRAWASRFVPRDGELVAQVWASAPGEPRLLADAAYWFFPPPLGTPRRVPIELDVVHEEPPFGVLHAGGGFGVGAEGKLPIAAQSGALLAAIGATPSRCVRDGYRQVHVVSGDPPRGAPLGPTICDGPFETTGNAWLFVLDDGEFGLLYRHRSRVDAVRYLRFSADGTVTSEPLVVGTTADPLSTVDGGFQPRGVYAGNGRILFTERRGGTNNCHAIRVMNADGSDAHDAPWQLPCVGAEGWGPERPITASVDLERVERGAILVYTEHSYVPDLYVTSDFPWREGIHAVLLDSDGRRGSEVVTVTDAAATALLDRPRTPNFGPLPRTFVAAVATQGDRAVVVWYDRRPGAEGVYARTLRVVTER